MLLSIVIVLIPPSRTESDLSGIIKSKEICFVIPKPLHDGHAPYGALKENILGSNSGREKSHFGQA